MSGSRDTARLVWRRSLRRIGVPGWVGLGVIALAGLVVAGTVAQQRHLDAEARQLEGRRARLAAAPVASSPAANPALVRVQLLDSLPPFEKSSEDLEAIFDAAQAHRIALVKGDYVLKSDPSSPVISYAVNLPVHEPYAAIKAFTAQVLKELPHAALDEIRVSRSDSSGIELESVLRFTLLYRPGAARRTPGP